ncbi:nucleoside diphosphate-linked moiety X motif 17-like [Liolophura sinensis]|uniref:nucleoside diphosphate-linked moiety X motif 17-like n=1 Tax=Liolophura sinensis TaxID=3198878 RepID=UPI003159643C
MAAEASKRTLVYLRKSSSNDDPVAAHFTRSVLDYFGFPDNEGWLSAELKDNKLLISDGDCKARVKIRRPPFCPIRNLTEREITRLPDDILNRGVDTGAAVILQTGDNKILLTRRASHLRTFPGIWVPPGGHIEENETIVEAGIRELREETGITLNQSDCVDSHLQVLALWESTFPPKLSLGLPKRHHIVVYILAKLLPSITSEELQKQIALDPAEVGASAWLDRQMIEAITSTSGGNQPYGKENKNKTVPEKMKAILITEDKEQILTDLPTAPLLETSSDAVDLERVSTGTKFVLEEWLKLT